MFELLPPGKDRCGQVLNSTQTRLEQFLGQGPKVVTRGESGGVIQNKNAETIFRMLEQHPELLLLVKSIEVEREQARRKHTHTLATAQR